ncbi:MAG: ABC transporter permease [Planctomycetota bacterium]
MAPNPGSERLGRLRDALRDPVVLVALAVVLIVAAGAASTFVKQACYLRHAPMRESIFNISYIDRTYIKAPPGDGYLCGRDADGMSVAERTLAGARISLLVGIAGALVCVAVGTLYGLIAGYWGGMVDMLMMRLVDVVYSLPYMFIVIILVSLFTRSIAMLFVALGLVYWLDVARIVRAQVLSLKEREFVAAARAVGAGHGRIIFRHILPNLTGIVIVYLTLTVPRLMLQESFLSFLGLNVQGQEHSWGAILNEALVSSAGIDWWMILFPGGVMFLTLVSLTVLGEKIEKILGV